MLPEPWATIIGGVLAFLTGLYSIKTLVSLIGSDKVGRLLDKVGLTFLARKFVPTVKKGDGAAILISLTQTKKSAKSVQFRRGTASFR